MRIFIFMRCDPDRPVSAQCSQRTSMSDNWGLYSLAPQSWSVDHGHHQIEVHSLRMHPRCVKSESAFKQDPRRLWHTWKLDKSCSTISQLVIWQPWLEQLPGFLSRQPLLLDSLTFRKCSLLSSQNLSVDFTYSRSPEEISFFCHMKAHLVDAWKCHYLPLLHRSLDSEAGWVVRRASPSQVPVTWQRPAGPETLWKDPCSSVSSFTLLESEGNWSAWLQLEGVQRTWRGFPKGQGCRGDAQDAQ